MLPYLEYPLRRIRVDSENLIFGKYIENIYLILFVYYFSPCALTQKPLVIREISPPTAVRQAQIRPKHDVCKLHFGVILPNDVFVNS